MRVAIPPPPDTALPALRTALHASDMHELIGRSLGAAGELVSCQPSYSRYKPATNCLVQYRLKLNGSSAGGERETLAHVKLFANYRDTFKPAAFDFSLAENEGVLLPETARSFEGGLGQKAARQA